MNNITIIYHLSDDILTMIEDINKNRMTYTKFRRLHREVMNGVDMKDISFINKRWTFDDRVSCTRYIAGIPRQIRIKHSKCIYWHPDEEKCDPYLNIDFKFNLFSVKELKLMCKENRIKGYSKLKKLQLITLLIKL